MKKTGNRTISKLTEEKRKMELLRLREMTPQQRLNAQVRLNDRVKKLFFAGLSSKAFTQEEIIHLWKTRKTLNLDEN